jgi:cyclopropane fatty-acyl-phospholipid synthase-like methyltransferase
MLELGCADGANLVPLAYHRRHAEFVGVDRTYSAIGAAHERTSALALSNLTFIRADFLTADASLDGEFDYVVAHGVFSWVSDEVRDALLTLCTNRLRRGGLLYLNYNGYPGWRIRGLVREFLLAQTARGGNLRARAHAAQAAAAKMAATLSTSDHPYSRLMADEFRFVCDNEISYVAHEYLAEVNHAYWRSDFLTLMRRYGLRYVADADFNYWSGRTSPELGPQLDKERLAGRAVEDTFDLLSYRQLHSPILTNEAFEPRVPDVDEFGALVIASCLEASGVSDGGHPVFRHPSGYEVDARDAAIEMALRTLRPLWPRGMPIDALFPDVGEVMDDLRLLHRNGLIELRVAEVSSTTDVGPLKRIEGASGGYFTTPYHTREAAAEQL